MKAKRRSLVRCGAVVACIAMLGTRSPELAAQVILPPGLGAPAGLGGNSEALEAAFDLLSRGEFQAALTIASREYGGSVRVGGQQWIDSIAAAVAVGECNFELGNLREAVAAYDDALRLSALHADWLLSVQFPPQGLGPMQQQRVATWGRSQRNTTPAVIPPNMLIRQGTADPQRVLQQGGALAAQANYPVRPQEIMWALVLGLYRRHVVLGESGRGAPSLEEATKALLRRSAPPNHYSQSWIDIALGTALWAQGKPEQAQPLLNRGLIVGNQFDHMLTAWGLIVLGRIALESEQPAAAARLFEEATFTAADYKDVRALEEAFRLLTTASLAAGFRGPPASIRSAGDWSRGGPPVLRAELLTLQAEALAVAGDAQAAGDALKAIDGKLLKGDAGRGQVGAWHAYAAALVAYATGATNAMNEGDQELERAVGIARDRSSTLFRTARLVEAVLSGDSTLSDRQADVLFTRLLGDPSPQDVAIDPVDAWATLTTPRPEAFDAWIAVASRRGDDALLNAVETAIRNRWLVTQPLGGRRTAVTRLLGADPAGLPPADAARRAGLLARHPDLPALLDNMLRGRTTLTAALAAAGPPDRHEQSAQAAAPGDPAVWRDYRQLVGRCEPLVAGIAAGRDIVVVDTLPLTAAPEIRRRLGPKQRLLSFRWTNAGVLAALESQDRVRIWTVRQTASVAKEIVALSRALSLYDPNAPVSTERLVEGEWPLAVERIERLLFEPARITLGDDVEELIIVPDGMLWYLPFELLPVGSVRAAHDEPGRQRRLRDVCRIRYCPTRSLAVLPADRVRGEGSIGIFTGRLLRGDKPAASQEVAERLHQMSERSVPLATTPGAVPVSLVASLLDTMVVFQELSTEGPWANRPLAISQQGRVVMTLGNWLGLPAKRATCVLLPALQTPMAGGLAKPPTRPGEELFHTVTSLMAAGARTVLVSRWRTGGETSVDLVEEFLRDRTGRTAEDGPPAAAESWQRAVDIVTAEEPDLSREPRLKQSPNSVLADCRHPFFWAGYVLADSGAGTFSDPPPPAAQNPPRPAAAAPRPEPAAAPQPGPQRPLNPAAPRPR